MRLTTRVLTFGSLSAATILGIGLALHLAGLGEFTTLGNMGVIALLLTPVAGLIATWWELKRLRPVHSWLAVAVLLVLVLATVVAVLPRV